MPVLAVMLLMIEILHDLTYQNGRIYGRVVIVYGMYFLVAVMVYSISWVVKDLKHQRYHHTSAHPERLRRSWYWEKETRRSTVSSRRWMTWSNHEIR